MRAGRRARSSALGGSSTTIRWAIRRPLAANLVSHDKFDVARYLGTLPLFSSITGPERERLAQDCHLRRLERGRTSFAWAMPAASSTWW
jgi:hypothetical protein